MLLVIALGISCTKNPALESVNEAKIAQLNSDLQAINVKHMNKRLAIRLLAGAPGLRMGGGVVAPPAEPQEPTQAISWFKLCSIAMSDASYGLRGARVGARIGLHVGFAAGNPAAGGVAGAIIGGALVGGAASYFTYKASSAKLTIDPAPVRDTSYIYNAPNMNNVGIQHDAIVSALIERDKNGGSAEPPGSSFSDQYLSGIVLSSVEKALIDSIAVDGNLLASFGNIEGATDDEPAPAAPIDGGQLMLSMRI